MNKIVIDGIEFSASDKANGKAATYHAMAGETLSADTVKFNVYEAIEPLVPADQDYPLITADNYLYFYSVHGDLSNRFAPGTPVYYHANGAVNLYYLKQVEQIAANQYTIECTSTVGTLIKTKHYGGIYLQVAASVVLADILQGVTYTIDPDLASATVTGYLPIASRRDNLQQVLLAIGGGVTLEADGTMRIAPMSPVTTGTFDATRCFDGGRVKETTKFLGLRLTEHNYIESGETSTLYEDGLDGEELVEFREPHHDLTITGGTIVESGANYAVISGNGAVVLTGKKYNHITRIISVGDVSGTNTTKTVSQAYLANPQVAQAIAERLLTVAQCNKTITRDVVVGTERAGDVVSILNPYTKQMETGLIRSMDISMSAVNRAQVECVVGFAPQGVMSGFTSCVLLTGSGTFTVPSDIKKIRIIVVGAGSGGDGGSNGESGTAGSWSDGNGINNYADNNYGGTPTGGDGGAGGSGGVGGQGGNIYEGSIDVTPGQTFDYVCGVGGAGGTRVNAGYHWGSVGGNTRFGTYYSNIGRQYPYGYYEAMLGLTLGAAGEPGIDGGRGGDGGDALEPEYDDDLTADGKDGADVGEYTGGNGLSAFWLYDEEYKVLWRYGGPGGGGAAYGEDGQKGYEDPHPDNTKLAIDALAVGGDGGNGSNGLDAVNYGQGGGGGHGGGGSGGGSVIEVNYAHGFYTEHYDHYDSYKAGAPGTGGAGGNGGDGCVIVYY